MPLNAGTAVTMAVADTAYPLITAGTHKLVKRVVIQGKSGNTGVLSVGISTLKPTTNTGIIKQLAPPSSTLIQTFDFSENDAPNGLDLADLFVSTTNAGDKAVFGYNEQ